MEPTRVELHNFTSYADATVDLSTIQLAALVGANGSGKSSIIDAFLWCLFGEATKGGVKALDNYVRRGELECRVAVEFLLHGQRYRVVRHRSAGKGKTLLELFQWRYAEVADDWVPGWEPISAKTVTETQEAIERLLRMDYRTFTASSLILQGKADSLTADMTDQERKAVLTRILGLDLWDQLQEAARERGRGAKAEARVLSEQAAQADERACQRPEVERAITLAEEAIAESGAETAAATIRVTELETQVRQRPVLEQQVRDLETQVAARTRDRQQVDADIDQAGADIAQEQVRLRRRAEIEAQIPGAESMAAAEAETLRRVTEEVTDLDARVRQADGVEQQMHDLDAQCAARQRDKASVEQEGRTAKVQLEQQKAILARADAIRQAAQAAGRLTTHLMDQDSMAQAFTTIDRRCRDLEAQAAQWNRQNEAAISRLEAQIAGADQQAGLLADVPCAGTDLQPRCQLLSAALAAAGDLDGLRLQLSELTAARFPQADAWREAEMDREALGYDPAQHTRIRQEMAQVQQDAQLLPVLEQAEQRTRELQEQLTSLAAKYRSLEAELTDLRARKDVLGGRLSEVIMLRRQLAERQQELNIARGSEVVCRDRLAGLRQSLADAIAGEAAARQRIAELEGRVATLGERRVELERDINELLARRVAVQTDLRALDNTVGLLREAQVTLDNARQQEARAREALGRVRQALVDVERAEEEAKALRDRVAAADRRAMVFDVLDQACGKKSGVPALIVENAVPQIEALTNDLLGRMAGGRLAVRLDTQQEGKSTGTMQEVLRITVLDGGLDRPYQTYSGAERFMVDLALRVALSKFLAHRSGAEIKLLVLDEGLGALDASNRPQVMAALEEAAREFSRVLVVTHIAELQDALPQRIEVARGPNGSTVKVVA